MNRLFARLIAAPPLALALLAAGLATPVQGAESKPDGAVAGRHYDLRQTLPAGEALAADPAQNAAIERWRATTPGLRIDRDARTGATRSVGRSGGYLTGTRQGGDIESLAVDFVRQEVDLLGLDAADLDDYEVTNVVPSRATGLTHIYLRQRHAGLPVYNAQLQINIKDDGRVLSVHNQFLPRIAAAAGPAEPALSVPEAVASLTAHLKADPADLIDHSASARLMYLPIRAGEARLVWNFQVETADSEHWYDVTVDAADGRVWTRTDWVAADTYKVYEIPVASPDHASPLPPADGRTSQVNPATAIGSPFGWHDTNGAAGAEFTTTQGNNVQAYTDTDANNAPDAGSQPDGGAGLVFDFPLDLTLAPSAYRPAAVTNLFYWNNVQHDVLYQFGFDEAAGNFQVNNYGNGGTGNDSVQAEAQDGVGTNNANFATPPDGSRPRMQMFVWTAPTPDKDGDLDNGIILHEYGHGVSNRLTGGPANVSCLDNTEQMGEGWSDWMTVYFTALSSHTATTNRGVGTYALNQPINGQGIRPAPYNTDMGVNSFTYTNLPSVAVPHGVGFVWNTMLWEMYWALVTEHGFDSDLYTGTGGNNLAMQLVIDGMKIQPCSPGFVDGRDAILQADVALTGGANQCLIWEAFAKRGLGFGASQGSSGSAADGTANFDVPTSCTFGTVGPDVRVCSTAGSHVQPITVGPAYTSAPVDMSATGNPAGSTVLFSLDPVPTVPNSTNLTVGSLGAVTAGTYTITVTGDDGVDIHNENFDLTVDTTPAAATTLVSPADNAPGVSTIAPLSWTAVAGITSFDVEVDDDSDFSSPEFSTTAAGTSVIVPGLLAETVYYWRVKATNGCGGTFTATRSFTTAAEYCVAPGAAIPDNLPAGISSSIIIPPGGAIIADMNISVKATHTWPGDVKLTMSHGGAPVAFYDRPGVPASTFGCSTDNVDVTINDEGTSGNLETTCNASAPGISGDRVGGDPANATLLQAFDGVSLSGTWTLVASDLAAGDTGTLTEWCLLPTYADPTVFIGDFEIGDSSLWSITVP
ncbi:MAG: M36 family metallopeptidase [Thermoanaerobaculia bacterium]|nr:M36 family metallopeptidase [Thermoanaerobaculia bacterium]